MSARFEDIDVSTFSLEQLQALMEMARKEIDQKEQSRLVEVRAQIENLASSVGRSVEELLQLAPEGKRKRGPKPNTTGEKIVKFRNTENFEQTWSGRGKRPRWLQEALEQGAQLSDFAVSA
ncbi:H-NS family nucleoid-associated regulatory protein [Plasticicumulans acidivorans]|uniref:DNA-binding protein H-NS n=1 Tax=Plasticicumulans acidivorans TaxID=886464 RepID=A0A317MY64_9GAMM|nr:H-NS histone family protein [Plasticicumulans acidivorans]PWV60461.1 DNA-binding protein H-NS [Plasticicumulans acidivorans]